MKAKISVEGAFMLSSVVGAAGGAVFVVGSFFDVAAVRVAGVAMVSPLLILMLLLVVFVVPAAVIATWKGKSGFNHDE